MVQFKDVEKVYPGKIQGVSNVNVTINPGEFVFLIGPSGSGKTTLLKMLIRDEKPSSGKIFFDDDDITHLSRGKIYRLRRQIGVIFQDFKLIPDKTAFENVQFAMEAAGKKKKEIKERVPYVLDIVGLGHRLKSFPKQLSGGEQQRVAIARALANNPKILIADEPTGNLDPGSAWDIVQILTKINNWGTTVIMSTHGTDIVNSLNKRVIQMEGGQVIRDDNKGEYEFRNSFEIEVIGEKDSETQEGGDEQPEKEQKPKKSKSTFKVNLTKNIRKKEDTDEELEDETGQSEQKSDHEVDFDPEKGLEQTKKSKTEESKPEPDEGSMEEIQEAKNEETEKKPKKKSKKKSKSDNSDESDEDIINDDGSEANEHLHMDLQNGVVDTLAKNLPRKTTASKDFEEKAGSVFVQELDIPNKLKAKLIQEGYSTVKDIVNVGPESLGDIKGVSDEDVIIIASAIEELLHSA